MAKVGRAGTSFSHVDASGVPEYFIDYLDAARRAPSVAAAKAWSLEHLHLTAGQRALDVGCGTGEDVVAMASLIGPTGQAIGIDASAAMISEAQRRHGHLPGVTFQVGAAEQLPLGSETLDACRVERTLQHLDADAAMAEMARLLKIGGRVALVEPDWETLIIEGSDADLSATILGTYIRRHTRPRIGRQLRGMLTTNGFVDVHIGADVVIHTDLASSRRAFRVGRAALRAVSLGVVSQDEAGRWLSDLERADQDARFFCSLTVFRAAGRKSLHRRQSSHRAVQ